MSSLGRIAVHSRRIFERSKVGAAIFKGGNPIVDTSVSTIESHTRYRKSRKL